MNLLRLYPAPNSNGGKTYNNYITNQNVVDNTWQWGSRMDWDATTDDQMFARFSYSNERQNYPPTLGLPLDGGVGGIPDGQVIGLGENFAFSETHSFSSTLFNEFRFGYNYAHAAFYQPNLNSDISPTLGLGGIPFAPRNGGLPNVALSGLTSFGTPTLYPNSQIGDVYEILDNVTKTIGPHILKAGVELLSARALTLAPPQPRGAYTFGGLFTSSPGTAYTGYGAADFLLNQMTSAQLSNSQQLDDSHWYRAVYLQDDWKASQRLTLNSEARYEYFQPSKEISYKQASFYATGPITPGSGQATLTYPSQQKNLYLAPPFLQYLDQSNVALQYSSNPALASAQLTNIAPRLGFAYSVDHTTVVRGGFWCSLWRPRSYWRTGSA